MWASASCNSTRLGFSARVLAWPHGGRLRIVSMADNEIVSPRLVVGLTGGIASGKSLVGAMVRQTWRRFGRHGCHRARGRGRWLARSGSRRRQIRGRGAAALGRAQSPRVALARLRRRANGGRCEANPAPMIREPHPRQARGDRSTVCPRRRAAARRDGLWRHRPIGFSSSTAPSRCSSSGSRGPTQFRERKPRRCYARKPIARRASSRHTTSRQQRHT